MPSSPHLQTLTRLTEETSANSSRVDRQAGVIRGVKILGRISANGREYSSQALDDAVRLYEGARVQLDHPPKSNPNMERSFGDTFGELRNVRRVGDGVFGDLHYLKSHPAAERIVEAAERFPGKLGLSHNADGKQVRRNGRWIVESLARVVSVDIVANPATNRSLFESQTSEGGAMDTATVDPAALPLELQKVFTAATRILAESGLAPGDLSRRLTKLTKGREAAEAALREAFEGMADMPTAPAGEPQMESRAWRRYQGRSTSLTESGASAYKWNRTLERIRAK